tara:strand:- start:6618 stop:8264 length:1647 start_codon:yes stop_codon:yes gene_type:complete
MAITLRSNKGTALTYNELDVNFSSVFYSASLSSDLSQLSLYYTGSAVQSASTINIPLNPYTGSQPEVAGNVGELQFKLNPTQFGGASAIVYDNSTGVDALVLGATTAATGEKLRVEGGDVYLKDGSDFKIGTDSANATITYGGTTKDLVLRNNFSDSNANIELYNGITPLLTVTGDGKVLHRGAANTLGDFVISGSIIFGKDHGNNYRSKLFTWDSGNTRIENNVGANLLPGNERGIILEGPHNAHILMGIQSTTGNESFSIVSAPPSSSAEPTYNKMVAHFAADGNIGIGTSATVTGNVLTVIGKITGSDDINIDGKATFSGDISGSGELYVSQSATISGSLTVNSIDNASSATNYNFLVQQNNDVVKQVNAAPIPQGGIIMWSGAVQSLPSGWNLCNGSTYNSVVTPDLRNKFVVASNNTTGTPTTTISGSAVSTGGNTNHDHYGTVNSTTLTSTQIPSHNHSYKDSYYIEYNNPGQGSGGTIGGADYVGPTQYKGSGDSDGDNRWVYWRTGTTTNQGSGQGHNHTITTSYHVPTFYSLAFIMYTG